MTMPWPCFICESKQHDCGHREPELLVALGMPIVRQSDDAWHKQPRVSLSEHAKLMLVVRTETTPRVPKPYPRYRRA